MFANRLLCPALVLALSTSAYGQKTLSLDDVFRRTDLNPKTLKQLQWIPGTKDFSFVYNDKLVRGNASKVQDDTILSPAELDAAFKRFPLLQWIGNDALQFQNKGRIHTYSLAKKSVISQIEVGETAENIDSSPDHLWVAYTDGQQLLVNGPKGKMAVNAGNEPGVVYGKSVHRNEFGIEKGTFWSPDSRLLAFYRMDESMVTEYPLVHLGDKPAKMQAIRYPMAGQKSHHVTVGIYDPATGNTVYLQTGLPAEQYLTNLAWTPDAKHLFVAVLNRDQNHMMLQKYRVSDGQFVQTLIEERDTEWVEPEHPALFLPDGSGDFLWQSERNGWNQVYWYAANGTLRTNLCVPNMLVTEVLGFDPSVKALYVQCAENNGLERHLWKLPLKGKPLKLSEDAGTHQVMLNAYNGAVLDVFSCTQTAETAAVPYRAQVRDGKSKRTLLQSANPLEGYALSMPELVQLPAKAGEDVLNARIFKPLNMEAGKKYPVVIYVYGGPHAQMVTHKWLAGANLWMSWLAAQDYVVWTLDNHGSADRGLEFEQAVHRKLGTVEMADQLRGVEYLKTLPYVDASRMGVHGWSFGGFMTTTLMTKNPGLFKAGVAGGPVIDWSLYEVMYTERYMDTPEQNPEGYQNANLLGSAKNLKDRLMLIHGTVDDVVVWQHSQEMVKQCVSDGVLIDYMIYPEHPHNVVGKDRLHLYKTVLRYLMEHL